MFLGQLIYHALDLDPVTHGIGELKLDQILLTIIALRDGEQLPAGVEKLTPIQRKRILMLLDDMSYTDIARSEGRDLSVISRSIGKALLNLRKLMEG